MSDRAPLPQPQVSAFGPDDLREWLLFYQGCDKSSQAQLVRRFPSFDRVFCTIGENSFKKGKIASRGLIFATGGVSLVDGIAHIREADGTRQSVLEHSINVAKLAALYGSKIGVRNLAYLAGLLHDVGKYSREFREYILYEVERGEAPSKRGTVDHSTAGARILFDDFHTDTRSTRNPKHVIISEILSCIIMSHHGGLVDYISSDTSSAFLRRINEKDIPEYEDIKGRLEHLVSKEQYWQLMDAGAQELHQVLSKSSGSNDVYVTISLLTKYLFSCLIDADRTDAKCFEEAQPLPTDIPSNTHLFETCYERLLGYLESLGKEGKENPINALRQQMSEQCDSFAEKPTGIYSLSIPTGGGKTLSSLRYALRHAVLHGKERIIYVIPFTSIIEQNAQEVREVLNGHDFVLEHHSNVIADGNEEQRSYLKTKRIVLAEENWDAPIIFTTMVKFLDAVYVGGTRDIRRFHNLANSVIIFDEVQALPIKCVSLFNVAINFLKNVCNSSILLCTATQPALEFVEKSIDRVDGEIVTNIGAVSKAFERVEIVDRRKPGGWGTDDLAQFVLDQIGNERSILAVLNTKSVVRKLYKQLEKDCETGDIKLYHLSTSMCAQHRRDVLDDVKADLKNGNRVICVSTQLIEAGVDISFDCVIRSLAGLDSVAQSAGRCNRHGEHPLKLVYVINHKEEDLRHLKTIKVGVETTERILTAHQRQAGKFDLLSPETMNFYFASYYNGLKGDLNYPVESVKESLFSLLRGSNKYKQNYLDKYHKPFPLQVFSSLGTLGDHFQVIDTRARTVLVPYEKGKELIADLNEDLSPKEMKQLLRSAQQYLVNVFEHEFKVLVARGSIVPQMDGMIYELTEDAYNRKFGICFDEPGTLDTLSF